MGTHPKRSVSATSVPRHTSNWSFSVTGEQQQISFQDKDSEKRTISKKTRASATEIMQWQEPARHELPPQKRGARGGEVQGAGCGAKARRGADAGVSAGAKVHGVRRVSVQVRGRRRARGCRQRGAEAGANRRGPGRASSRGRNASAWGQKSADAGVRRTGAEERGGIGDARREARGARCGNAGRRSEEEPTRG